MLIEYLQILWRRKWVIILTTVITVGAAAAVTTLMPTQYEASTRLRVMTPSTGGLDYLQRDIDYAVRLMNTYAEKVTSDDVLNVVMERLELDERPEIAVEVLANTELMVVTATASEPELAQQIANTTADVMVEQIETAGDEPLQTLAVLEAQMEEVSQNLEEARRRLGAALSATPQNPQEVAVAQSEVDLQVQIYSGLMNQYTSAKAVYAPVSNQLTVFQRAEPPTAPSRPNRMLNLIIGLALGLVAGVSLALLFENLDTRLHSVQQIEAVAGLPVIGAIPKARGNSLILNNTMQEQAFRRLRHNVLSLQSNASYRSNGHHPEDIPPVERTLLITSASPREGKSTVAVNLGLALARVGRKVVLIDANLQRPALHRPFNLENEVGLSSVLLDNVRPEEVIQPTEDACLFVMTTGPETTSAMEMLDLATMTGMVEHLSESFDYVLLDSPALWGDADAIALAPAVEGVVVVTELGTTHEETLRTAVQELETIHARTLGIVANRTSSGKW